MVVLELGLQLNSEHDLANVRHDFNPQPQNKREERANEGRSKRRNLSVWPRINLSFFGD